MRIECESFRNILTAHRDERHGIDQAQQALASSSGVLADRMPQ
jgi:hypothetical protein